MCFVAGDYRCATNRVEDEDDFFACEAFRQIVHATWPVPRCDVLRDMVYDTPDDMKHLTAHQVAYVDVKVGMYHSLCLCLK